MSDTKKGDHIAQLTILVWVIIFILLFAVSFITPDDVANRMFYNERDDDSEISESNYQNIDVALTLQRIKGSVDEDFLSLVEDALEDSVITQSEMAVITKHNKDSKLKKASLIEEVKRVRSSLNEEEQPITR